MENGYFIKNIDSKSKDYLNAKNPLFSENEYKRRFDLLENILIQNKLDKIKILELEIDQLINIKRSETSKRKIKSDLQKRIISLEDEINNLEYKMKASISIKTKIKLLDKVNYY